MLARLRRFLGLEDASAEVEEAQEAAKELHREQEKVKAKAHAEVAAERRRTDTERRAVNEQTLSMTTVFPSRNGKDAKPETPA